ncbi:MAG: response regulator [Nevskia sp.]|nr:response regulator [Nevskia sp.]
MRFLLIEDDVQTASSLARALGTEGDYVDVYGTCREAEQALRSGDYGLLILDLGLPDQEGSALLRDLRARHDHTPVLVLTARDELDERVRVLNLGADDYLSKPFDLAELQARIRAITRRTRAATDGQLVVGNLRLDLSSRQAEVSGRGIGLSPRELTVLEVLMLRPGRVTSRHLMRNCLDNGGEPLSDGALDVCMHRIRKKIESSSLEVRPVRGLGYILQETVQKA